MRGLLILHGQTHTVEFQISVSLEYFQIDFVVLMRVDDLLDLSAEIWATFGPGRD